MNFFFFLTRALKTPWLAGLVLCAFFRARLDHFFHTTLSEKNKRLIKQRYVILHLLHRGAHGFEQKFIQAAGVPVFPEHSIAQVVKALDDYAVLGGGEVYLEFPFFHRAFLLYAFIICRKNATPQMCEFVHLKRNSGNSEGQDKLDSVWSNPDKSGHPLQKKNRSQRPSWNRKNEGENAL